MNHISSHGPAQIELAIHLAYDDEADIWYVAETDIPGLILEAETSQALIERLIAAAPEMIALNLAEILQSKVGTSMARPKIALRPVFDSPLELASA